MSGFLWRMGGALAAGVVGLSLIFWQLEHVSLLRFAGLGRPSAAVYLLLFAGLLILNAAVFYVLRRWGAYLRENPGAGQLPPWLLAGIGVLAGAALVAGIAVHASWVRAQDPTPLDIREGFIAYEVSFATLALVPLVLLAVRWSHGYRRN
ncbi:hypothetical protein [Demequina sp.]|uniref:hypothetical protein n=1 Tax=Demequina sp. TaxID=2050685 RepID=UPI0025F2A103|nr:hypothetical protein [Demequina sp.]